MEKGKCTHFNGTASQRCRAGVSYVEAAGPDNDASFYDRLPCFAANNRTVLCEHFHAPSEEELRQYEEWLSNWIKNMTTARHAIKQDIEARRKKNIDCSGQIDCPICKTGKLSYSYAGAYNGHIHADCSTEGCVHWIE